MSNEKQQTPTDPNAPTSIRHTTFENIIGGIGSRLMAGAGMDFSQSQVGQQLEQHYQARLADAQRHHREAYALSEILSGGEIDPNTGKPTGIDPNDPEHKRPLTPEQRTWYKHQLDGAWADYTKAAGVSKETKADLQKKGGLLQLLVEKGPAAIHALIKGRTGQPQAQGSGQAGTGAATPAPTGLTPPPPAPEGAGTGAAPEQVPGARVTTSLTPPPAADASDDRMWRELNAPRLEQHMAENQTLDYEKRKQDIITQGRIKEEQAKTFAERAERPYTVETLEGVLQWNPDDRTWTRIGGAKPKAGPHETEEDKYIAEYMEKHPKADRGEAIAAYKRLGKEGEIGTWQLAEDSEGKTILYNSKTGETRAAPEGLKPKGAHAKETADYEKNIAPAKAAQEYADDYLASGAFTGPGDEALMEKFFELAKPSAGFRMTKPQQDMLRQARSWTQGTKAQMWHAWHGTWFSDEQRQQIVQTMRDLAKAKMSVAPKGLTGPPSASNPLDDRIKAAAAAAKAP